jgi:polar amino acid transport system substrate-binding protein
MRLGLRSPFAFALTSAVVVVCIAGCSSSSPDATAHSSAPAGSSVPASADVIAAVPAAVAAVPAAVKAKGTLDVAMEAQYRPFEYLGTDNRTIVGIDPDIAVALGATLGLKVKLVNAAFETIIPGLQSGRYDLGVSAFNVTSAREKVVDFVTYFAEGDVLLTKAGNPGHIQVEDLCGKTVAVGKGSSVESVVLPALTANCRASGKPAIIGSVFTGQAATDLAVVSGRVQATIIDQTAGTAIATSSGGQLAVAGDPFDKVLSGIVIPKASGITKAVQAGVQSLIDDGTYARILAKWSVQGIGITSSQINPAVP